MRKEVKKLLVLGIILWLAGAASFLWVFAEKQRQQRSFSQQHELYNAKLVEINQLAYVQEEVSPFRGVIDEAISLEKPEDIPQSSNREMISYFSAGCMALGTIIFLSLLLIWLARAIAEKISNLKKNLAQFRKKSKEAAKIFAESNSQKREETVQLAQTLYEPAKFDPSYSCTDQRKFYPPKNEVEKPTDPAKPYHENKFFIDQSVSQIKPTDQLEDKIRDAILSSYHENAMKTQDSFKEQSEKLEKQVAEIKNLTESITQASAGNKSLDIGTLAEQVAAIRDYASCQQERVTKLQEGYDWNIIRTFCLRVIRCIDNIDARIVGLSMQGDDTSELEDVKDELVFALESSGVEQFEPEINSSYASLQKMAEAVKERKPCDEPEMKGNIAEVIKPGYRYVIDEDNAKVVRASQVKLFG